MSLKNVPSAVCFSSLCTKSCQALGTCQIFAFRKAELGVSWESPRPPVSPARNKAAIVNSPNFTTACRNPVLPFSHSSTSTLCRDQSGHSRPQKPEALASSSFNAEFDTPQLSGIQASAPRNLFPFVKQQYPSQKKMLAQQKVCGKTLFPSPKMAFQTSYSFGRNKKRWGQGA